MPYPDLPYQRIPFGMECDKHCGDSNMSGFNFDDFDEKSFLDDVCREFSDHYLRFRKYLFVLTERAILKEGFNIRSVVDLWRGCGQFDVHREIERGFGRYQEIRENDKNDLMLLGLVHCIYDNACLKCKIENKDMNKAKKRLRLAITIAFLLSTNKDVILKLFDLNIEENLWQVQIQAYWLLDIADQYTGYH